MPQALQVRCRASICAFGKAIGRTATTICRATRPSRSRLSGTFSVDRDDYRLNGSVAAADLRVLLDVLNVKDDQDGFFTGDGDIYVEYTVSNGIQSVSGRWPASDTRSMGDHDTAHMNVLAASLPAPSARGTLSIHIRVFDEDGFLADGDDQIGDDTFTFSSADDFGATATTHVRDLSGYRITFSMAKRPPPVIATSYEPSRARAGERRD